MDTPTVQKRISELRNNVGPYAVGKQKTHYTVPMGFKLKTLLEQPKFYLGLTIFVLVILILFRPSFLYKTRIDLSGKKQQHFSWSALLLAWAIITVILFVAMFGLKYKLTKEEN